MAHHFKLLQGGGHKVIGNKALDVVFMSDVVFGNFVGLLQKPLLQFDQVPVVPVEERDLALGMLDFANDSHPDKVVNP